MQLLILLVFPLAMSINALKMLVWVEFGSLVILGSSFWIILNAPIKLIFFTSI